MAWGNTGYWVSDRRLEAKGSGVFGGLELGLGSLLKLNTSLTFYFLKWMFWGASREIKELCLEKYRNIYSCELIYLGEMLGGGGARTPKDYDAPS